MDNKKPQNDQKKSGNIPAQQKTPNQQKPGQPNTGANNKGFPKKPGSL